MPAVKSVWGIDVGQCALKALRLRYHNGRLELLSFDVVEHHKILSQPDADEQQLISHALKKFLSRNDIRGSAVAISVPGQASFTRFIKLPPVDVRKVNEIVRYEARQQIPFDLADVIWDHQVISPPTAAPTELEVGIFAMKRDIVNDYTSDFVALRIEPDIVQMAPIALYNFFHYDKQETTGATLIIDVGAQNTNLIISDGDRVWIRNVPMGGNNFTQALSKTFNLTFGRAEKLKRHASESKHARKIFQVMRPVFSDLLMEIQRSIGYYTSLHRESRIERVLALGNTFRLPGLRKFFSQGLGIEVQKFQGFNSLSSTSASKAPLFRENVLTFGTAFGLAVQGLGLARISTNLLPAEIHQRKVLRRKRPYFVAAAASLLIALGCVGYNALTTAEALRGSRNEAKKLHEKVQALIADNQQHAGKFNEKKDQLITARAELAEVQHILEQKNYIYKLTRAVWDALPYDPRWPKWRHEAKPPRNELGITELLDLKIQYVPDLKEYIRKQPSMAAAEPMTPPQEPLAPTEAKETARDKPIPAIVITIEGTTPRQDRQGRDFISEQLVKKLLELPYTMTDAPKYIPGIRPVKLEGEEYRNRPEYRQVTSARESARTTTTSLTTTEAKVTEIDKSKDWWFKIVWICSATAEQAENPQPESPND